MEAIYEKWKRETGKQVTDRPPKPPRRPKVSFETEKQRGALNFPIASSPSPTVPTPSPTAAPTPNGFWSPRLCVTARFPTAPRRAPDHQAHPLRRPAGKDHLHLRPARYRHAERLRSPFHHWLIDRAVQQGRKARELGQDQPHRDLELNLRVPARSRRLRRH